ncbi:AMP-dependent synthetase/ligase [Bifidobacterium crudilactis]|uniref:AMP-dependent synthetase/ligase n=1 Tax=Bifidobacterium crudilactis TaxID=327277 RepID=UPI00235296BA|nr:AMP-dependent synthetase/ligase [Bifidobacterium crudilactis]
MSLITSAKSHLVAMAQRAATLGRYRETEEFDGNEASSSSVNMTAVTETVVHDWSTGYPTITEIDSKSGLLTTSTAGAGGIPDDMTVYDLYSSRAQTMPDEPMYHFQRNGKWVSRSTTETLNDIRSTAKGLLHAGMRKGDSVAFMCHTSYEWNIVDAAVLAVGGIIATIYDTDSAEQIRYIVNNSDASLLIVETREMREKADGAIQECESLQRIACLENGTLEELQAYGASVSDEELDARIASVKANDLCSIVYTSGSTAAPKGVEMTHAHYCNLAVNLNAYIPDLLGDTDGSVLLFLPQAHSFARAINYACAFSSIQIFIAQGIKSLISDLQVAKPTVMIGVPRVFEKVYNAASQKAGHGAKGMVFAAAAVAAQDYMRQVSESGKANTRTGIRRALFDPVVYSSLRQALGGRAKWIVSGGAPLDPALLSFFRGADVPVYEGYGLTETTAPCAFSPLGTPFHEGSVGIAFPDFSLRIAKDGEIQISGTSVFHRYHKNDEATASSFTEDGWYATGDLGRLDGDGFLYITGRKKDLIITAGGKNVSPGPIEEIIQRSEVVSRAVVLGDKRPFISALVTLDEETLRPWLASKGLNKDMPVSQAAQNAAVRAEVQKFVEEANEGVSRAESVRKFIILPEDFTQENGLLTASMKVIRPKVISRYTELLNTQMYTPRK